METFGIRCKVCDEGILKEKKLYRKSVPVVVIGYIFLLPSLLGILMSVMMFFGSVFGVYEGIDETRDRTIKELVSAGMELDDAKNILMTDKVDDYLSSTIQYTDEKVSEIKSILSSYDFVNAGTALGFVIINGIATLPLFILFLGYGLVGWFLTKKKKVLKCSTCEAVVNAS